MLTVKRLRAHKRGMKFHEKLQKLILSRGRYQSATARVVGVSPQTIKNWMSGDHEPKFEDLRTLSKHFGVPFGWLVDSEDSRSLEQVRREEEWLRNLRELHPEDARRRIIGAPYVDESGKPPVYAQTPKKDEREPG